MCNPTATSEGAYGAQFWLNGGKFPDAPRDMFYCSGFQGQMVAIIPSLDLVIVRMGLKEDPDFDFNGFESDWEFEKVDFKLIVNCKAKVQIFVSLCQTL
jgi:CubicO group peptidase (beta-lactamase class C family)